MTTEAGRRLLDSEYLWDGPTSRELLRKTIAAIEAEARAAALAEVRAVEALARADYTVAMRAYRKPRPSWEDMTAHPTEMWDRNGSNADILAQYRRHAKAVAGLLAAPAPSEPGLTAIRRAWEVGLRGEFIRLVASALPSVDEEGNGATDVATGMADHFEGALLRLLDAPAPSEPGDWRGDYMAGHRQGYSDALADVRSGHAPAPSEPGLDADTLVVGLSEAVKRVALAHGIRPTEFLDAMRAEYARLRGDR